MRTFRLIGMALFAIMMCVNFTACSNDEEEDSNTTIAQLKGIWFNGENENYPYFIIEDGYCYFSENTSVVTGNNGEKYKYTFDSKTNIMTCYQYDFEESKYFSQADYFKVKSISATKLTLEILDDNQVEVYETMNFIKK